MKQGKLWIFNFDGTLAVRSQNNHAAQLDSDCKKMLLLLIKKFPGRVAVISSRSLQYLSSRIRIPGLFLGGTSGLIWLLPGGEKKLFHGIFAKPLYKARAALLPMLKEMERIYGVDIEDKLWSITLHVPHLPRQVQRSIFNTVQNWRRVHAIEVFRGPESVEVLLVSESTKATVFPHVCSMLGLDPDSVQITYAGNEERDVPLMQWVLGHKGSVYTISNEPLVSGGRIVKNPSLLAREFIRLCEKPGSAAA